MDLKYFALFTNSREYMEREVHILLFAETIIIHLSCTIVLQVREFHCHKYVKVR